ncbi:MAG: family efflux transporter [Pseudonocardiales bacterium]|nr:family efflux transporter [Pseudonocardiales bacterium]
MLVLAGSAFAVLAAEPLYLLVDTAVVGHLGAEPLAALGIGAALLGLITLLGTFLEYGTTARAARWFGAGRPKDAAIEGVQATWLALWVGLAAVAIGQAVARPLTHALAGGPGAVADEAELWFRVAVCGVPGVLIVLAGNGWLRGVQETRSPVIMVLIANGLSAAASPILVYPLGLGLVGSAYANVGAQAVASVLFVRALLRAGVPLRPSWTILRAQLVMGWDLFLRAAGFQAAFLTSAAVAARMGTAQLGAHQIALQLWEFSALLLDSFAIAAQALVGAALGSGNVASARRLAWRVARYGLWAGIGFGVGIGGLGFVLPQLFTSSDAVIHQAHVLWPWFAAMQPAAGVVFALDGVLLGAGDAAYLRTLTLFAALAVFVPIDLAALHWQWGIGGVWAGLTAFVVVRLIGTVARTTGQRWSVAGEQR